MSSVISPKGAQAYNEGNVTSYFTNGGNISFKRTVYGVTSAISTNSTSYTYAIMNDAGKTRIFCNDVAKPVKLDVSAVVGHALGVGAVAYGRVVFNGETIQSGSYNGSAGSSTYSKSGHTSTTLSSRNKSNAEIKWGAYTSRSTIYASGDDLSITLYFTRYDFTAAKDSNVTTATVSSSTGYDGDTVTFRATIPSGYAFDGWYNGDTLVSSSQEYAHTVNGADLTLTAKAHPQTHNVNGTYNGSTRNILSIVGDCPVIHKDKIAILNSASPSFTIGCGNKLMNDNITIGSVILDCKDKVMLSDLVLTYV